jgi:tetratricopeptide (TPR) repeat protein
VLYWGAEAHSLKRKWRALLVAAGFLGLSCIQEGARSGLSHVAPWVELRSQHFTLVSDLDEADASHVIASFEETYDLLGSVVFGGSAVPSFSTNALIFESPTDLNQFIGEGFGGMYIPSLPNDAEPSPTLLASGTLSPFARLAFSHELTHRFNHVALGPTPTWLNEGLADYYSTLRSDHGQPVSGEIDPRYMCTPDGLGDLECYRYEKLPGRQLPSASEVIALDRSEFYGTDTLESGHATWEQKQKRSKNYGVAWLLVHMLMHGKQGYAQEFRRALAAPPSPEKGQSLAKVLSQVSPAQLDRDFRDYLKQAIPWRQHHAALPEPPANLERHALSDAQVNLWLARLDSFEGKFATRARQRLNAANQSPAGAQPDGAASFWLGRYSQLHDHNPVQAARHYRQALEREPGNPEYLYGLVDLYWSAQSGLTWLEATRSVNVGQAVTALSKTARSPRQLNAVAAYQLFGGDLSGALRSSEQACKSGLDCWPCFHNRAAALFASGQAAEAVGAERTALDGLPEDAPPLMAKLLSDAVNFYEQANENPDSVHGKPRPGLIAP